jgi:hypothetical protein
MSKIEMVLVTAGVLLMALAAALLVVYRRAADCVDVTTLHCHDVAFAYEGGGKLALLSAFLLFLIAALLGLFRDNDRHPR